MILLYHDIFFRFPSHSPPNSVNTHCRQQYCCICFTSFPLPPVAAHAAKFQTATRVHAVFPDKRFRDLDFHFVLRPSLLRTFRPTGMGLQAPYHTYPTAVARKVTVRYSSGACHTGSCCRPHTNSSPAVFISPLPPYSFPFTWKYLFGVSRRSDITLALLMAVPSILDNSVSHLPPF